VRLSVLEASTEKQSPAMKPQRFCRRRADETGRPCEELLRESEAKAKAFFESYTGGRIWTDLADPNNPRTRGPVACWYSAEPLPASAGKT